MRVLGVQEVPLASLTRFPGNARVHAEADIRASVKRLGQYRTLVVRQLDGQQIILAGNGTADALQAEGYEKARVELLECTDDEARRINLADNRLSDIATDDKDALAELLSYLEDDYAGTGWSDADVAKLIEPPDLGDAPEDDLGMHYGVIIECSTEEEQLKLLERLAGEGLSVRSLMT
jgi:ParB-like chromosome segregation protein Spo0J